MSFRTDLDPFDRAYAHFVRAVREAIQQTFAEEANSGLTQKELSETLGVDAGLISRRLGSPGNMTLRSISDLFTAMGREPLSNFSPPEPVAQLPALSQNGLGQVVAVGIYSVVDGLLFDQMLTSPTNGNPQLPPATKAVAT